VQRVVARPGTYVSIARAWRMGDRLDIDMPFSFRAEPTLDQPAVQALYYGPTLLALEQPAIGKTLDTALVPLSFYRHVKLDGDLAPAMTPAAEPLHFTTGGYRLAPFFVADPSANAESRATAPYHLYVRRHEPQVVFGSIDSGVANRAREDGRTFLDEVWAGAPFAGHRQFVAAVTRVAAAWQAAERLSPAERTAVVAAAGRAERDLA
jgi:DUF1680 family protein